MSCLFLRALPHHVPLAHACLRALSKAKAEYFERNLRLIDVLIDQDAIKSGAAAAGQPWRYYDLGHGLCTYDFFDTCPHRMACAKCSFYVPKGSSREQIIEGKATTETGRCAYTGRINTTPASRKLPTYGFYLGANGPEKIIKVGIVREKVAYSTYAHYLFMNDEVHPCVSSL